MRIIKLPILFTAAVLVLLLLFLASISCSIIGAEKEEVPSDEEKMEEIKELEDVVEVTKVDLWISEAVPDFIRDGVEYELGRIFDEVLIVYEKEDSDVWVEISTGSGDLNISYILAPVVSFFRNYDEISYEDIRKFWTGESEALNYLSIDSSAPELIVTEEVYGILEKILGPAGNDNIRIVKKWEILEDIENDNGFSIVPFDGINKKYKVLNVDGMSVLDKELEISSYPLAVNFSIESSDSELTGMIAEGLSGIFITNRNTEELASVIMTGVTAIATSKNIGLKMDELGVLYPALEIAETLWDADITHISNEICFVEGCSTADKYPILCSKPEYIELLEYIDPEVIELTGNHMNDKGPEWMPETLDMYDERGWLYFGGGRNLEESYKPALLEAGGNKFAFLGCNSYGLAHIYEWAGEDSPGAARLNVWDEEQKEEDFEKVEGIIKTLKEDGYIVIFTFQYKEEERYSPTESQIEDFRRIIDAGADIVSGSQSHYPMGVEFRDDGFINYGLGNLFFNMRDILGLKQGIIAKHIFYKGEHINTILITTMLENLSQVRLTTPEERVELLNSIFSGSIR
jgi:hypothetical protein